MIKRTLFFSKPYYLITKNEQLVVTQNKEEKDSIPIEDIGFIILDHHQIILSIPLIGKLLANNVAVIYPNDKHYPVGMLLTLESNTLQQEVFSKQIQAGEALKKQLWKQTIQFKIDNQARLLNKLGIKKHNLNKLSQQVVSGDTGNCEAVAAKKYWHQLFKHIPNFTRNRFGNYPNNLLNYGYMILRAAVARALSGSGLLATLGIHHHNRYNAFCLADDIMEPYRPYVDEIVFQLTLANEQELTTIIKTKFLQLLTRDVEIQPHTHPLMIALSLSSSSLTKCFYGKKRKIIYPKFN